jgi:hypothetical protein
MYRYRLRTLLIALALAPHLLAAGWWASESEEAQSVACAITVFVIAVWLGTRAVIYLNTHM